jgi:hypothetical protein
MYLQNLHHQRMSQQMMNVDNVKISYQYLFFYILIFLVDESFEIESKRLLSASERISESISRYTISNDQVNFIQLIFLNKRFLF